MFLTGQVFENAATQQKGIDTASENSGAIITYHGKPVEVKDRFNRFCTVDENIWNNPYRATSGKINSFYHAKDQEFKRKFRPPAAELKNYSDSISTVTNSILIFVRDSPDRQRN